MTALVPCPSCHRHVRLSEGGCPFCGDDLATAAAPPPIAPRRIAGLGRAAIVAFGATLGAGAAASGCVTALYGAPAPDSGTIEDGGAMHDAGIAPMYGAAPVDAG